MAKIEVRVIDSAGNQTYLPLPNDRPLNELIPAIVTLLDLNTALSYRIFAPRFQRVLIGTQSLYANGIQDSDTIRLVTPPQTTQVELELLDEPSPGARLALPQQNIVKIGRGSINDIVIAHPSISREHGEFIWQDGIHIFRDLNSANGSMINNQVVSEPTPISLGSILTLGDSVRLVYQEISPHYDIGVEETNAQIGMDSSTTTKLNPLPSGLVFLSYHPSDMVLAKRIVQVLREANYHVFWAEEIPPGSNFQEALRNALRLSDALVAILTPAALENSNLIDQWHEFFLMRRPMVSLVYQKSEDLPHIFLEHPVVEFKGDVNRLAQETVDTLKNIMS
ncbi:MAG: hypothetical protein CUN55_06590 [Phototrophicales bacterium]|nr:MAG: hypothetical protein CUN55_06590 [Phototrophicales bacterium]